MVNALEHLHARGVVFKDLKAENIVISASGIAKLTDFGLAVSEDQPPEFKSRPTTPHISAPECLLHFEFTAASDWWAFGCLLYEMSVGKPAFSGISQFQIRKAILERDPCFPAGFDPDLQNLITRLLDKDHSSRVQTAAEVKNHPFFLGTPFENLEAPCKPHLHSDADTFYFEQKDLSPFPSL